MREGFNPDQTETAERDQMHDPGEPFTVGEDDEEDQGPDELGHEQPWEERDYSKGESSSAQHTPEYGSFNEERSAWGN